MSSPSWKTALSAAVLLLVVAMASWRLLAPIAHTSTCDLSLGPCTIRLGEELLTVELDPLRPRPGQEMRLSLKPSGNHVFELDAGEKTVDFSMPGMNMGEHVMTLEILAPDLMEGRIDLPACPMGHSLWQASIQISDLPVAEVALHVGE